MTTEQPNVAPNDVKPEPHDADSAATVLDDAHITKTRGGGGRGGADAADVLSGSGKLSGGATPNSLSMCQFPMAVVATQLAKRSSGL
ncbi:MULTISPECIES: hypothetical protein [unclassified Sphingomonas]|uniref:hypothetical protein n=1 Tax=unclassified Sphingomonas TaxID=196159 RepID=UPI0006FE93F3|nr:hypothetical protein [Sphingomonas sp. Leaf20]KQM68243.1 hypothetical protein ASE72_18850 [Sphingomonas sp. Leaf20]